MPSTAYYENLRDFLAMGWHARTAVVTLAGDAGVPPADVLDSGTPRNIWHDLLSRHPDKINAIANAAKRAYPGEAELIDRLAAQYAPEAPPGSPQPDWQNNPYAGLEPITDPKLLFGREAAVDEVIKALDQTPFLTLYGASGAGKSSLLSAGVAPKWRSVYPGPRDAVALFTPGADPFLSLHAMG